MKNLLIVITMVMGIHAFADDCKDYSKYPDVSIEALKKKIQDKTAFIVDVNSEESFKKNHVDTAIHFAANESKFAEVLPKDKAMQIIAYCGGPQCTAWQKAAVEACKLGYTNVAHFKGGIKGWVKSQSLKN